MKNQKLDLTQYCIDIGDDLSVVQNYLAGLKPTKVAVLVDDHTKQYCLPILTNYLPLKDDQVISISPGEEEKTLQTCQLIWDFLMVMGADRKSLIINLGGGVIGDMGGFCASTYMRGIPFIQIPTTLLSQVDASIGGKVAIDYGGAKNLVGSFCDPLGVIVSTQFLSTLPARELRSGFAEMIKHGLIRSSDLYYSLLEDEEIAKIVDQNLIIESLKIKKEVVESDPKEHGVRKILNFWTYNRPCYRER